MSKITIPEPINKEITFRWFVEYVVDNSPVFKTSSAIAKSTSVLNSDLDTVGSVNDLPEPFHKLIIKALSDDENPLQLPQLQASRLDESGNPVGDPILLPLRIFSKFINALIES